MGDQGFVGEMGGRIGTENNWYQMVKIEMPVSSARQVAFLGPSHPFHTDLLSTILYPS